MIEGFRLPKSAKYFTRAIVQSGPGSWNWNTAQIDSTVNDILKSLCSAVSPNNQNAACDESASMLDTIDALRDITPGELNHAYYDLYG